MGTTVPQGGVGAAMAGYLHLVPALRMSEAIRLFLHDVNREQFTSLLSNKVS